MCDAQKNRLLKALEDLKALLLAFLMVQQFQDTIKHYNFNKISVHA